MTLNIHICKEGLIVCVLHSMCAPISASCQLDLYTYTHQLRIVRSFCITLHFHHMCSYAHFMHHLMNDLCLLCTGPLYHILVNFIHHEITYAAAGELTKTCSIVCGPIWLDMVSMDKPIHTVCINVMMKMLIIIMLIDYKLIQHLLSTLY